MKNIELLFLKNKQGSSSKIKLSGNTIYINILPRDGIFTWKEIDELIEIVNIIHKQYGKLKIRIEFYFGKVKFIDKLTYVFLECICYYLIKICGHPVQVFMEVETDIRIHGISSSPLLLLNRTKLSSIQKFPERFDFEIYGYHFRRVIHCEVKNTNYLGNLYEDIDRFLKPFCIDEKYRDEVSLVVAELVGNACEHAESDCLVDIDVAPDFKKYDETLSLDPNYYYGINIAVINFSNKILGDDIGKNILNVEEEKLTSRYLEVLKAYEYHKTQFNENYSEDDFRNMTTFQSRISGRKENFATGGTGLTVLIKSLEDWSDTYRCYAISGTRRINFFKEVLEYDSNGWIGFNTEKNYLSNVPKEDTFSMCSIYMPGTAYNFNFVMKGKEIIMDNVIELKFDKATTRLAGNPYGRSVFEEQVEAKMNYECLNVIIFPYQIEKVASSFVQGFFAKIVNKIGYAEFDNVISIEARDYELIRNIRKDLFV